MEQAVQKLICIVVDQKRQERCDLEKSREEKNWIFLTLHKKKLCLYCRGRFNHIFQ